VTIDINGIKLFCTIFRAFGTVLRALSDDFALTSGLLPYECIDNWLQKILHTTNIMKVDESFGVIAKSANKAVCILMETFRQIDDSLQNDIFNYLIQQTKLDEQKWPYESDAHLLRLILKVIDLVNHDACASLASAILSVDSRLWSYRFLYSNAVSRVQ
jgi:hypothetical protein